MVTPYAFDSGGGAAGYAGENTAYIFAWRSFFRVHLRLKKNEFSAVRVFKTGKNRRKKILNLFAVKPLICDCRAKSSREFFLSRKIVLAFFRFLCYMEHRTVESFRFSRVFSNVFSDEEGVSDRLNLSRTTHEKNASMKFDP